MSESYSSGSNFGSQSGSGTGSSGTGSANSSNSYGGSTGTSGTSTTSGSGSTYGSGSQSGSSSQGQSGSVYSGSSSTGSSIEPVESGRGEGGRTVLIGVLGGLLSAAGYAIYQRLPDEQKARLQRQVRGMLEQRLNEIRQNFNI